MIPAVFRTSAIHAIYVRSHNDRNPQSADTDLSSGRQPAPAEPAGAVAAMAATRVSAAGARFQGALFCSCVLLASSTILRGQLGQVTPRPAWFGSPVRANAERLPTIASDNASRPGRFASP